MIINQELVTIGFSNTNSNPERVFKTVKHNLPKSAPPKALQTFLDSVHDDILHTPLNKVSPNLAKEEREAMEVLIKAQRERFVTLKPNDKSGGCSILNLPDYGSLSLPPV